MVYQNYLPVQGVTMRNELERLANLVRSVVTYINSPRIQCS